MSDATATDSSATDSSAPAPAPVPALDAKTLLDRVNQRLSLLRDWISHDHRDEPWWWARRSTAPQAQSERVALRQLANLLHIERATSRGRIHGTRFATLDEQHAWLAERASCCLAATESARLPSHATLALLRAGKLPL